jgi:peptidoglycan hydrolase-like protein with peptidoglycan-binding domain
VSLGCGRLERSDLNWRGVAIFVLAVLTVILLINVIDDDPTQLGVNTADTSQDDSSTVTTLPGATSTTKPGTTGTTKPSTTATTRAIPATKPVLSQGATGAEVMTVQTILASLGYYTGTADGQYGPGTAAAVTAFQTQEGITPADGQVNAATWDKLATSATRKTGT